MFKYRYYILWWTATLLAFLCFDIFFCLSTSFKPFEFKVIYPTLIACATLFSLPAAISVKSRWQIIVLSIISVLFKANLMYCRTYSSHIPLECYTMASNLKEFGGSVIDSMRWYDIAFPAIIIVSSILSMRMKVRHRPSIKVYLAILLVFSAISYGLILSRGGFRQRMAYLYNEVELQHTPAPVYSVFACIAYEWMTRDAEMTEAEKTQNSEWMKWHKTATDSYAGACSIREHSLDRPNVVIILCESLESWPIGLTLEGKEITPFLNSLVADSTVYYNPNVITQVRAGRSIDGQLLMIAGQYPMLSAVYSGKYTGNTYHTIPKAMKERGARSIFITSDHPTTWNQGAVARAFGADTLICHDDFDMNASGALMPADNSLSDQALFSQSVKMLDDGKLWPENEQVFLMLVTHSGHNPFTIPESMDSLKLTGKYPEILKNYLTAANYTDRSMKTFVDYLRSRPDWKNTILVITGDHEGLASYREGLAGSYSFVSDKQITPLIITNAPQSGIDSTFIGQIDVYSAILDAAGEYGTYLWRGMGISPFSPDHPRFAIGSNGSEAGPAPADSTMLRRLREAPDISDRWIRHRIL